MSKKEEDRGRRSKRSGEDIFMGNRGGGKASEGEARRRQPRPGGRQDADQGSGHECAVRGVAWEGFAPQVRGSLPGAPKIAPVGSIIALFNSKMAFQTKR